MIRNVFLTVLAVVIAALTGCASSGDVARDVQFVKESALLTRQVTGEDLIAPEACEGGAVANRDVKASADGTATRSTRRGEQSLVVVKASKSQVCATGPATTVPEKKVAPPASAASAADAKKKL